MLQVSDAAAAVLEETRSAEELPETVGVRVFAQPDPSGDMQVSLTFAEEPLPDDEVTEQAGTQVYIAPEVAEPLSDSVLDLEQAADGPQLVIKPQSAGA